MGQRGAGITKWIWLAAMAMSFVGSSLQEKHLRVVYAKNGYFWLSGCCDDFINQCEQEYGNYTGPFAPSILSKPLV